MMRQLLSESSAAMDLIRDVIVKSLGIFGSFVDPKLPSLSLEFLYLVCLRMPLMCVRVELYGVLTTPDSEFRCRVPPLLTFLSA